MLRVLLVLLGLALVAAVAGGLLLLPPTTTGFPAVEGQIVLRQTGTGTSPVSRTAVQFRQHAIGIAVRCNGTGTIRVVLHPSGAVESPCKDRNTTDGGYVLSDVPVSATTWEVTTRPNNQWSVVFTQPVLDGTTWTP